MPSKEITDVSSQDLSQNSPRTLSGVSLALSNHLLEDWQPTQTFASHGSPRRPVKMLRAGAEKLCAATILARTDRYQIVALRTTDEWQPRRRWMPCRRPSPAHRIPRQARKATRTPHHSLVGFATAVVCSPAVRYAIRISFISYQQVRPALQPSPPKRARSFAAAKNRSLRTPWNRPRRRQPAARETRGGAPFK